MKVTNNNVPTVISLWRRCYLDGGEEVGEIQTVWEPGVEVNIIIF